MAPNPRASVHCRSSLLCPETARAIASLVEPEPKPISAPVRKAAASDSPTQRLQNPSYLGQLICCFRTEKHTSEYPSTQKRRPPGGDPLVQGGPLWSLSLFLARSMARRAPASSDLIGHLSPVGRSRQPRALSDQRPPSRSSHDPSARGRRGPKQLPPLHMSASVWSTGADRAPHTTL